LSESSDSDLVTDWQHVMAEWDRVSAEHANTSARYSQLDSSAKERAELAAVLAELSTRLRHLKEEIGLVIKRGQAGRSTSGNEFVAATLRTEELSESPDATPHVDRAHR
jgi:hypothetical protein